MEYLIGLLVFAFGGAIYFKRKADESDANSRLAETRGRDKELTDAQIDVRNAINEMDQNIREIKEGRRKGVDENLTDKEKANRWDD